MSTTIKQPVNKQSKSAKKTETQSPKKQEVMVVQISLPPISPQRLNDLELRIDRARWFCLSNSPFYGQLMMGLRDKFNYMVLTACTNGEYIIWNPDFVDKQSDEELRYILIHETAHCAYGHLWRFPPLIDDKGNKRKDEKGNIACDHVINLNLNDSKLNIKMPAGGLANIKFKGLAEEEVYKLLPDSPSGGEYGANGDPTGDFTEPEGEGDGDNKNDNGKGTGGAGKIKSNLRDDWERRVIQAAQAAKASGQGDLPADLQRILDERMAVRIDWRVEMADFLKNCFSYRNDWTRSPKRHAHSPIIMPRKRKDAVSMVVFVRDTSGSVDDATIALFNNMIEQCTGEMNCFGFIFDCDAALHHEYPAGPGLEVPKTAKGGGGTDFCEPFERTKELIENGDEIAGLIYLTDGYGSYPDEANIPEFPTLWLMITDQIAPFGRTVKVQI